MKKARMNISHSRFILSKLKIFGEIVTTKKLLFATLRWRCDVMQILVAALRGAVHQQQRAAAYAALLPSLARVLCTLPQRPYPLHFLKHVLYCT